MYLLNFVSSLVYTIFLEGKSPNIMNLMGTFICINFLSTLVLDCHREVFITISLLVML